MNLPITVRPKRATLEECKKSKEILKENEIIMVQVCENHEPLFKLGDGVSKFDDLHYVSIYDAFKRGRIYVKGSQFPYVIIDLSF